MGFVDHLDVLRMHLIRSIVAVFVLSILAFFFKEFIFDTVILAPKDPSFITNRVLCALGHWFDSDGLCMNENDFQLINIELAGQFRAHLIISVIVGVILGFPYLVWELWRFIKPAFSKEELKNTNGVLFYVSLLFTIGVSFGYYMICPLTINFLTNYIASAEFVNTITIRSYISMVTTISLSTGLVFQLPILMFFLAKMGLINPVLLRKYRKHAIVALFILSGIITPPDVFTQFLVVIPLYLLFEMSITITDRVYKKMIAEQQSA